VEVMLDSQPDGLLFEGEEDIRIGRYASPKYTRATSKP